MGIFKNEEIFWKRKIFRYTEMFIYDATYDNDWRFNKYYEQI